MKDAITAKERTFDFSALNASPALLMDIATAFKTATSSEAGTWRTIISAVAMFRGIRSFCDELARSGRRPTCGVDLTPADLTLARLRLDGRAFDTLRAVLRRNLSAWSEDVRRELFTPGKMRKTSRVESYSMLEFTTIMRAARLDIRRARDRIRPNVELLHRWRDAQGRESLTSTELLRGEILDQIARSADVPRWSAGPTGRAGQPNAKILARAGFRSGTEALHSLLLTQQEITAFMVLMVGVTGQNVGTLNRLEARAHSTSVPGENVSANIVETIKPRRGKYLAHSNVVLSDLPPWLQEGSGKRSKDLRTPFAVHSLLVELGATARAAGHISGLFAWYGTQGGKGGVERSVRDQLNYKATAKDWTRLRPVTNADGSEISVSFQRLRLSFVQHQNRPVAHTATTLADQYQIRDRAGLARYQEKVAEVLDEQVRHARATSAFSHLTPDQISAARTEPARVAREIGVRTEVLEQLLDGSLDTVLAACTDNQNGPTGAGQTCKASFLMCLECPCALATPAHWTAIVHTLDEIVLRKSSVTQVNWAVQFGAAHERLKDLMGRLPQGAVERARSSVPQDVRAAVTRMLDGEWGTGND